jgi:hypothetical protein
MISRAALILRADESDTSPERQRQAGPSLPLRAGIRSARAEYR